MRDLNGVNVVVTGVIGGESRRSAEAKLRDAGALVQSSVGLTTDLLVIGAKVGARKVEAAEKYGLEIVPWDELWSPQVQVAVIDAEGVRPGTLTSDARGDLIRMPAARPRQLGPMLCKAGELPVGPGWMYEVKWDGLRCVATVQGGSVTMMSRSGKSDYVGQFPQIAGLLAEWPDVVLDGELVVLDDNGDSSLASIGNKAGGSLIVFDVVELLGEDLRRRPLSERRQVLEHSLKGVFKAKGGGRIAVSPAFDDGEALLAMVAERRLEGLVAKKLTSRYLEGTRGGEWIKVKLRNEQEFAVIGWIPGNGALAGTVGGLLLAVRHEGRWLYVGRAGSGPSDEDRADLHRRLAAIERNRHPEVDTRGAPRAELAEVTWVEPELVVRVAFQRWTEDGRLVHPSLKGLREDKAAEEITREA